MVLYPNEYTMGNNILISDERQQDLSDEFIAA